MNWSHVSIVSIVITVSVLRSSIALLYVNQKLIKTIVKGKGWKKDWLTDREENCALSHEKQKTPY